MSEIGILTDKGTQDGAMFARIDDQPYKVLPFVNRYLDGIPKGSAVEYELSETNQIKKIAKAKIPAGGERTSDQIKNDNAAYNAAAEAEATKRKAAGFDNVAEKPADQPLNADVRSSPKTVKGTVSSLNAAKNILVVEDTDGITHGFFYPSELDVLVKKQKPGWFVEVTYRTQGDRELLADVKYAERPAGQKRGYGGGKTYTPRNEKPMIYESAFKSCVDLVRDTDFPGMDYATRVEAVAAEADKIAKWIAREGGA